MAGNVGSLLEVGTGFHPELTGLENVYLNGTILGMSRAAIDRRLEEIVDFAEVDKFLETPVKRYSSGMRVRLAFAVAAHLDPEILIVDEVLSVGDAGFQAKCLDKMKSIASDEGRTVLYVSHNLVTLEHLCPRSLLLADGRLVFDGPTEETVARYLSTFPQGERGDDDRRVRPRRRPTGPAAATRRSSSASSCGPDGGAPSDSIRMGDRLQRRGRGRGTRRGARTGAGGDVQLEPEPEPVPRHLADAAARRRARTPAARDDRARPAVAAAHPRRLLDRAAPQEPGGDRRLRAQRGRLHRRPRQRAGHRVPLLRRATGTSPCRSSGSCARPPPTTSEVGASTLDTAVALSIFDRPDTTRRVFAAIAAARPRRLFVFADGPALGGRSRALRASARRDEAPSTGTATPAGTSRTRTSVPRLRYSSGVDWVFSEVDEAIVLDDDCLPDPTFFGFCEELLARYRDDPG